MTTKITGSPIAGEPLMEDNDTTIPEHLDPHVDPAGRTTWRIMIQPFRNTWIHMWIQLEEPLNPPNIQSSLDKSE
jgi:hypothetical protein